MFTRTSHQEGCITTRKRSDGSKAFRLWWYERTPQGEWKKKSKQLPKKINGKVTTKKGAQGELDNLIADLNRRNGCSIADTSMTFQDLVDRHWDDYTVQQKMRPSTLDGYKSVLKRWIEPFFGSMQLSRIDAQTVSEFMASLRKAKLSDKYQKNIYSLLTLIFDIAVTLDMLPISPIRPKLHRPRIERNEKPVFPFEKLRPFFEALPEFWRAPVAVLMMTGMRQGELLGLRWKNLDFKSGMITLTHVVYRGQLMKGLKTQKEHTLAMSPILQAILEGRKGGSSEKRYQELGTLRPQFRKENDYVFCREDGSPLDPDYMRRSVIYPALEAADIEREKWGSGLHMFRHTVGSKIHALSGSIKMAQEQLGHSNIQTTANIYTHIDEGQKKETANLLEGEFAGFSTLLVPQYS